MKIPARIAWACGLLAIALELTVSWGLPAAMPGHSLLDDYISTAGATDAPHPRLFAALGITAASLHFVFAVRLAQMDDAPWHRVGAGLFALFFVLLAIGLAFRCDPGCALETPAAWTHFWFGLAAFLSLGLAALIVLWTAWRDRTPMGRAVVAASAIVAILDVALLLSDQTHILRGLTERLTLLAMAAWGILWMVRLGRSEESGAKA